VKPGTAANPAVDWAAMAQKRAGKETSGRPAAIAAIGTCEAMPDFTLEFRIAVKTAVKVALEMERRLERIAALAISIWFGKVVRNTRTWK
jgi:hypothetical protein